MRQAPSSVFGVLLLGAGIAFGACSKPEPPRVTPRSVTVGAVSPAGIGLSVELDVYNPNSFPILAESVAGTLELGSGIELGRGRVAAQTSIAAKGSSTVNSQIAVSWTNVAALAPFALSTAPVPYTFRGVAAIGGERLNVDVPFTIRGELTREQLLQAGLRGLGNMGGPMGLPLP